MDQTKLYDVFICYRESDGVFAARLLRDYLQDWGLKVFVDFEASYNTSGSATENIKTAIMNSTNFLLLITPDTFNEKINDRDDWVTMEIKWALAYCLSTK
jgi:hypothetical protein